MPSSAIAAASVAPHGQAADDFTSTRRSTPSSAASHAARLSAPASQSSAGMRRSSAIRVGSQTLTRPSRAGALAYLCRAHDPNPMVTTMTDLTRAVFAELKTELRRQVVGLR